MMTVSDGPWPWLALGFAGQALFFSRFLVQWIAAERRGIPVVPVAFWYLSLAGGLLLLLYAVWRGDPVFMAGQAIGACIYGRNLALHRRKRRMAG